MRVLLLPLAAACTDPSVKLDDTDTARGDTAEDVGGETADTSDVEDPDGQYAGGLTAELATGAGNEEEWYVRPCSGEVVVDLADGVVTGTATCGDDTEAVAAFGPIEGGVRDGALTATWSYVFWGEHAGEAEVTGTVAGGRLDAVVAETSGSWWSIRDGAIVAER